MPADTNMKLNELKIYAIFDKKSNKYDTPFFAFSDLFAKRRYILMAEEDKSPLAMWPTDFELHRVGIFQIDTGKLKEDQISILQGNELKI